MDNKKPIFIVLAILFFGSVYLILTAKIDLKYHSCHMPIATAENGFYLAACKEMLHVSPTGKILNRKNLEDLSLSPQIYSMAQDKLGSLLVADMSNRSLSTCEADLGKCQEIIKAGKGGEVRIPFVGLPYHNSILVADPNNDRLVEFDSNNKRTQFLNHGFKYPNHISIVDDRLIVSDTSNHRIVIISFDEHNKSKVDEIINLEKLRPDSELTRPHTTIVDKQGYIWSIMADHLIVGRELVLITPARKIAFSTLLPEDGEPFDLSLIDDGLLISDPNNATLSVLSANGVIESFAEGSEVDKFLAVERAESNAVKTKFLAGFIGAVVCLIIYVIVRVLSDRGSAPTRVANKVAVDIRNPNIKWIESEKNQLKRTILILSIPIVLTILIMSVVVVNSLDSTFKEALEKEGVLIIMPLFVLIVSIAGVWFAMQKSKQKIGVLGNTIIYQTPDINLLNKELKIYAADAKDIEYSHNLIFIGERTIPLAMGNAPYYSTEQLVQHLFPLLLQSKYIDIVKAQSRALELKGPTSVIPVVLIAGFFVLILVRYFL